MVFGRDPVKLESKALQYEQRGKTAKALKYREKAARLRASHGTPLAAPLGTGLTSAPLGTGLTSAPLGTGLTSAPLGTGLTSAPLGTGLTSAPLGTGFTSARTPQRYEQNALKWEQRGNWTKAQKNREKVWRLQNPQYGPQQAAPMFYQNNRFLGYNTPFSANLTKTPLQQGGLPSTMHTVLPATVERHVHPTVVEQITRPEKIVEIQPVVHREIEAPRVHVVEKHLYETVPSTGPSLITKTPIVEETVKPRIIEEIQPVVHREVPAPFVERIEQHVTERVTQPTTMTKEVINDATVRPMGMAAGGPAVPLTQTTTTSQGPLAGVKNAVNNLTHRR